MAGPAGARVQATAACVQLATRGVRACFLVIRGVAGRGLRRRVRRPVIAAAFVATGRRESRARAGGERRSERVSGARTGCAAAEDADGGGSRRRRRSGGARSRAAGRAVERAGIGQGQPGRVRGIRMPVQPAHSADARAVDGRLSRRSPYLLPPRSDAVPSAGAARGGGGGGGGRAGQVLADARPDLRWPVQPRAREPRALRPRGRPRPREVPGGPRQPRRPADRASRCRAGVQDPRARDAHRVRQRARDPRRGFLRRVQARDRRGDGTRRCAARPWRGPGGAVRGRDPERGGRCASERRGHGCIGHGLQGAGR